MSEALFPSITGAHWRDAIRRGRSEGNTLLARIRERISRQATPHGEHRVAAGQVCRPDASTFTAAGSAALARREVKQRAEAGGGESFYFSQTR